MESGLMFLKCFLCQVGIDFMDEPEHGPAELHPSFQRVHNPISSVLYIVPCGWGDEGELEPAQANLSIGRVVKFIRIGKGVDM